MSGIYIHIPFCRQKCHYCNFFSIATEKYHTEFREALLKEIRLQKKYLENEQITSVYFGGGTPSLLSPDRIDEIISAIRQDYIVSEDAEITLEANPDDLNPGILKDFRNAGVNRLSIGIQSFYDDDLVYLNRIHTAKRASESLDEARKAGFSNISIDLIYGIPGLSDEKWTGNLKQAYESGVPHISAYALTVEPKTALDVLIRKKKLMGTDEEQIVRQFRILMESMKKNGFVHYEISNFCKDSLFSRHNSLYWNGTHYLGLGPSAHSFNGHSRQWNIANMQTYLDKVNRNEIFYETEELTGIQKYNEYIMVSLRTMWGCDSSKISSDFGAEQASRFIEQASVFIQQGKMIEKEGIYYLTDEGKLFADGIASDLFLEAVDSPER